MGGRARRAVRMLARSLIALASTLALAGSGVLWWLAQNPAAGFVTSDAAITAPRVTAAGEPFTALLVGLDARTDAHGEPLPQDLLDRMHVGPDEGQLHTDTIILLHVPADPAARAVAISIPRDSYVPIAGGFGTHKINSAYRYGLRSAESALSAQGIAGAELDRRSREAGRRTLVATVEQLTGISVDHFAEIGMAGFVELTEALGGVPVCLNAPVRDERSGVDLPAGPQLVSGTGALAFVRQRHGLSDGDLDRIARQQVFAASLAQRMQDAGGLTDPIRLRQLLNITSRYVVVDRGWDVQEAVGQARRLSGDRLTFQTIPTGRTDLRTRVDGIAVEIDQPTVQSFVAALMTNGTAPRSPLTPATPTPTPSATVGPRIADAPRTTEYPTTIPATPTRPAITPGSVPCVD